MELSQEVAAGYLAQVPVKGKSIHTHTYIHTHVYTHTHTHTHTHTLYLVEIFARNIFWLLPSVSCSHQLGPMATPAAESCVKRWNNVGKNEREKKEESTDGQLEEAARQHLDTNQTPIPL